MLTNKKIVYLGATLFSAMTLTALSNQTVKAATTTDSSMGTTTVAPATSTSSTTTTKDPVASSLATSPSATTSTASATSSAVTTPTTVTASSTTTAVSKTIPSTTSMTSTTGTPTVTSTSTATAPSTSATTGTTVTSAPTTSSSSTTTSAPTTVTTTAPTTVTTTAPSTSTTTPATTLTTGSTSSIATTSTGGLTLQGSSIPSTTPTATPTGTATSTSTTGTDYSIPANITNSTVVNFTDPTLGDIVKQSLNLKPTDNITVGDIKGYTQAVTLQVNEMNYMFNNPATSSLPETKFTPIESLNGIQYLKLLPSDMIDLDLRLGSDANANLDLTPLQGLKFNGFSLIGNFSNPQAKEIDVNQITKLNPPAYGGVEFYGDSNYNGITNDQLKTLAPWIIAYSNNGQQYDSILLNGNAITDYSSLKGINRTQYFNFNNNGGAYDPTPIYAVKGQPITFTSQPVLGLDGDDLASGYHLSTTVPAGKATLYNLKNLGNDKYELDGADETATVLTYGDAGFDPRYNPTYSMDGLTDKTYGNDPFLNIIMHAQPLIWQDHPNVTINYLDSTGKPIMSNGVALTKTVDGNLIGDSFDLTPDSTVAGYTLTSKTTSLKGTYTQNPQTIDLTYSKNPTPPASSNSSSTSTTSTTPTKPVPPVNVTPKNREAITIYNISGNPSGQDAILADMGVKGTTTINGKLFYLVGYGQLVAADSYNTTKSTTSGTVRTFDTDTALVNAQGVAIGRGLAPNTEWKYSRIVTINGADYYQVATNEYLPVLNSVAFTPTTEKTAVNIASKTTLYNSQGKALAATLPAGSNWATDGCAIINGIKMYRVATDEWVSSVSSSTYQPVATVYRTSETTTLYDISGKALTRLLPAGTSWKVDQIVTINGQKYFRVATGEYVLDNN